MLLREIDKPKVWETLSPLEETMIAAKCMDVLIETSLYFINIQNLYFGQWNGNE